MDLESSKYPELRHSPSAVSLTTFEILKERALQEIGGLGNSYHNRFHTEERVLPACEEYAREAGLSPRDSQKLAFAALYHDFGHPGSTYRQLVCGVEGSHLSNEEYAATKAAVAAAPWFSELEVEEISAMILASSHGQNHIDALPSEHAAILYRSYRPISMLEKILVLADVSSFRWGTESYLRDGIKLINESSADSIPDNFAAFMDRSTKFLTFIQKRLEDASPFFSPSFTAKVLDELESVRADLAYVATPEAPDHAQWKGEFEATRTARRQHLGIL